MPFFTRTGKMTKANAPRSNSFLEKLLRGPRIGYLRDSRWNPFGLIIFWRAREIEERLDQQQERGQPWHGLSEAELTDEQEDEAQRLAAREWHHPE